VDFESSHYIHTLRPGIGRAPPEGCPRYEVSQVSQPAGSGALPPVSSFQTGSQELGYRIMRIKTKRFTYALTLFIAMNLSAAEPALTLQEFKQKWLDAEKQKTENERALVPELHKLIVATSRDTSEAAMKLYTNTVSVTHRGRYHWGYGVYPSSTNSSALVVSIMVPLKGGEFMMGSPETEADRRADEGPPRKVKISPFWMQQCEVTWDEYVPFMMNIEEPNPKDTNYVSHLSYAVSKPSKPYLEYSHGMGKAGYPAVAMTQHAANKYCEWLSAKTGHFYRLPTEAEWEYACRAGTTNVYSFGDNRAKLPDYGWFFENSNSKYQKVGRRKPNPWGLYDMHGNVAEWCLDQYDPNFYGLQKDELSVNPWNKATRPYPHVVRGGSWDDDPEQLRSAARGKSDKSWKTDPTIPPSFWYADQSRFVGFRVVRPLKVPTAEEMHQYWNSGVENEMPPRW
jgi:formylglycine-generating enzyme required for sulfatase activity